MEKLKKRPFLIFVICLVAMLAITFLPSFDPSKVLFSNDGPLGAVHAAASSQPEGFTGIWYDLNTIGHNGGSIFASLSSTLLWVLGPLGFAKFYVPIVLAIVGLCAWFCFRQLKLSPLACLLGGLAAMLNSSFFSATAWGVGSHVVAAGLSFFAVGLLSDMTSPRRWAKVVLAGFAVGLGIMEGFDLGAIYSLAVALFVVFQVLAGDGPLPKRAALGAVRLALVAACAAFLAFQAVTGLVQTQIKGVAGTEQDTRTKSERWDWATQWSLPKREALSLVVPGLFGFRMDSPEGGNYWGAAGRDPAWDRYFAAGGNGPQPDGFLRYTGGGNYLGVFVALVALWCALQALRKKDSLYPLEQRKAIWFWSGMVVVCLLLAFGRHAPFYQLLYALPYFSTIRNPAKFLHILSFATVILFAYGVHGLTTRYLEKATTPGGLGNWWAKAGRFDKLWVTGCGIAVGASVLGWFIYASSRGSVERYLQTVQFDEQMARQIANFSIGRVVWFALLLLLAVGLLIFILSGRFSGPRARWGAVLMGLLVCLDLGLANRPWILYWNWKQKYATNPVIEFLRQKPYEQRVYLFPMDRFIRLDRLPREAQPVIELYYRLTNLYRVEWAQHHFQYFNIQSLDIVQMPRMPVDLTTFERAMSIAPVRRWELTNTRYLLAPVALVDFLNQQFDPEKKRFQVASRFDIEAKPGVAVPRSYDQLTANMHTNGAFALIEFTGALPRARLYSHWEVASQDPAALKEVSTLNTNEVDFLKQVGTNDFLTLKKLSAPAFDPAQTVLLAEPLPGATNAPAATNQSPGTVEFVSYSPKRIVLHAKAPTPGVLLLNDKYDPNWKVTVDGKPQTLLRCNYIMRGVQLPAGDHQVQFSFEPPIKPLYVSLVAIIIGLGLVGFTFFAPSKPVAPLAEKPKREVALKA